jgi:hypothetical protein
MAGYLFPGAWVAIRREINIVGNYFCRKRDINDPEENTVFEVRRETLLLWPDGDTWAWRISGDLKFYWLHFEIEHSPLHNPIWR